MKIDIDKIRRLLKQSPFSMQEISKILGFSERNLYYKLKRETLTIRELNLLINLLNIRDISDILKNDM